MFKNFIGQNGHLKRQIHYTASARLVVNRYKSNTKIASTSLVYFFGSTEDQLKATRTAV